MLRTDDGSYGITGMVTTAYRRTGRKIRNSTYDVCVAIGPMIMMKFVCLLTKKLNIPTIVSHEPDHGRRYRYVRCMSCYR